MSRNIQYITNAVGQKIAVILPIEEYENLMEDLHVIAAAYESRNDPCTPFSDVMEELMAAGEIDF